MARHPTNKPPEGTTTAEPVIDNNQDNSGTQPAQPAATAEQAIATNKPVATAEQTTTTKGNLVKVKNEGLKGKGLFISNGTLVRFDDDGVAEFDKKEAARLLSIPGYVKA